MKFIKRQVVDAYVQGMWSTQWHGTKYVVWIVSTKTFLGIKIMENTEVAAVFDTKPEARKHAKRLRSKYHIPMKFNR
mgnify:FL=1